MTDFRCWRANRSARCCASRKTARVTGGRDIARCARVPSVQVSPRDSMRIGRRTRPQERRSPEHFPGRPGGHSGRRAGGRSGRTRFARRQSRAGRPVPPRPRPSLMSVPRPAMFVATVIWPGWPAPATICASSRWRTALRT